MSAFQILQQTQWPFEKRRIAAVTFAILQPHLKCNFATFVRVLASDVPQRVSALMSPFNERNTPLDIQLQALAGLVEARAHGFEIPAEDFIASALEILQPSAVVPSQPTSISSSAPPPVGYGYGIPSPLSVTTTSPIAPPQPVTLPSDAATPS